MSALGEIGELASEVARTWADVARLKIAMEAEHVRQRTMHIILSIAMLLVGFVVLGVGLGFVIAGSYKLLSEQMEAWAASMVIGGGLGVLAIIIVLAAKRCCK